MARLQRVTPVGIPTHIIQRGNNQQPCFRSENDMQAYTTWLNEYSKKYAVSVHAWVFMPNHVHLLCTPNQEGAISKMMQSLGRSYVRYFNSRYHRTGTLWEGRYKSCLVQSERYMLEVYRYIENNPVRSGLVASASDYAWSSYQVNALGKASELSTPHAEYLQLGYTNESRMINYQLLFLGDMDSSVLDNIRKSTHKNMALGNDSFKDEIEKLTGRRQKSLKVGRPAGRRKRRNRVAFRPVPFDEVVAPPVI